MTGLTISGEPRGRVAGIGGAAVILLMTSDTRCGSPGIDAVDMTGSARDCDVGTRQ